MAPQNVLLAIIDYLDPAERKFLRGLLAGQKLTLFDFAVDKKKLGAREIRSRFPELNDSEFATLRSRLHDQIVESMGEFQRKHRPESQVQVLVEAAELLMHKGQAADAQRTLAKAAKLAISLEEYGALEAMQVIRRRLAEFLLGDKKAAAKWESLDALLTELAANAQQLQQIRGYLQAAFDLKQGGLEGRRAKTEALLAQLPALDQNHFSKATLLLARTMWLCKFFLRDDAGCEALLDWVISHGKEYGRMWAGLDTFEAIEAAHSMKAAFLAFHLHFGPALALLNYFQDECLRAKKFLLPDLTDLHRLLKAQKMIYGGNPKTIQKELVRLRKEIGVPNVVGNHLYALYLNVLVYCLEQRDFQSAEPWLALLVDGKPLMKRASKVIDGFVVELAIRYASQDYDEVENAVRRLIYFAETRQCDQRFVDIVAKGFRNLAKAGGNSQQALEGFIAALESNEHTEEFEAYAVIFDLKGFLLSMGK